MIVMKNNKITYKEARMIFMKRNPYLCGLLDEINRKLDILIKKQKEWVTAFDMRHH
jgi:hypothetical protein